MEHFKYILILLTCAVCLVSLCRRLSLPPIVGYLGVGILVGPGGLGIIPSIQELHTLAEFGVVFLMFTIGLEFSITRFLTMKRAFLGLGGVQVLLCTVLVTLIGWALQLPLKTAFLTAGVFALSSTAVVIKQLTEQQELHTTHGRLAISILLFQDLAAVLFLIFISAIGHASDGNTTAMLLPVFFTLFKGIAICIVLALLGQWLLRPIFHEVSKAHSTELFMLTALLTALGAAGITHYLELSMALGAFLAGLLLGETEFRHQIEIDIRPFRDVLLGLFFITIGALFNIHTFPKHWHWVLLLLFLLIASKTLLIMGLIKIIGRIKLKKAFRTGIILAQGGEFGFVLLTEGIHHKLIDLEQSQIIIATIVLSIMIAPLLIRYNHKLGVWLFNTPPEETLEPEDLPEQHQTHHMSELSNHVIVCGFGRVGQILTRFLEQEQISSVALDLDPLRISSASLAGEHAFFGDVRHPEVLAAAGLARARMVVISFADEPAALETIKHIRALRLDVPVFVRTRNDSNLHAFQQAGATEVVPESLEASLMLASHLLLMLGVPASRILLKMRVIHADRYRMLQGFFKGADDETTLLEDETTTRMSLHAITVSDHAYTIGKSIQEMIDPDQESPIKALIRGSTRHTLPSNDTLLEAGDVLVLYATPEALYLLEEKILRGL
jgi:CPA2 family monovalent cation:H+ antiporter-2